MAILKVLTYPDPFLQNKAERVTKFDEKLKTLLLDMAETMYEREGIGLAAMQIGSKLDLFVMDVGFSPSDEDEESRHPRFIINPQILEKRGESIMEEGCLSVPEFRAEVKRARELTLIFQDEKGETHKEDFEGLAAVCVQHEMDHLQGILFIDYLPPLKRKMVQTRLKKRSKLLAP